MPKFDGNNPGNLECKSNGNGGGSLQGNMGWEKADAGKSNGKINGKKRL